MSSTKGTGADEAGLPSISIKCEPYTGHSVVTVVLSTRRGRERADYRLARWHVRLTRADLAGHNTRDVLLAVLAVVVQRLERGGSDPADWHAGASGSHEAVGSGAPASGATGAVQDSLPGLGADSPALGGLDLV